MDERPATPYRGPTELRPLPPLETVPGPPPQRTEWVIRYAIGAMIDGHGATDALRIAECAWEQRTADGSGV